MTDKSWYVVKRNWPQTADYFPHFAGLGGDVWPLDSALDASARAIHADAMARRRSFKIGALTEFLCENRQVVEAYWSEANARFGDVWLIQVSASSPDFELAGFDIAFPSGGYSVIETELITQRLRGPSLNQWGLMHDVVAAEAYLEQRARNPELEVLDGAIPLAIKVIRPGHGPG